MKKKILFSLMTIALVGALVGGGIFAYFSDIETSEDNTFTAGTLDVVLSDWTASVDNAGPGSHATATGGVSFSISDVAPGDTSTTSINLTNGGSIDALSVYMEVDVTDDEPDADTEPEGVAEGGVDTYDISKWIEIISITYDGVDVSSLYSDANSNGWLDLDDLNTAGEKELTAVTGVTSLDAGETDTLSVDMLLRTDTDNKYQGDRSTITVTFTTTQD